MRVRALSVVLLAAAVGCSGGVASESDYATAKRPASRVELKITVRADQIELAREVLGLEDSAAELRQVTFYDTPDLALYERGIILRARDVDGGEDDSTVKVRPLAAKDVDRGWFAEDGFKCEIDRTTQKSVSSCSLTVPQSGSEIREVAAGDRSVKKLFASEQEDFVEQEVGEVPWDALTPLGPIAATVWTVELSGVPSDVDAELWTLPDGVSILEVSTKVKAADADATANALAQSLAELGLDASKAQETKTKTALEYFSQL